MRTGIDASVGTVLARSGTGAAREQRAPLRLRGRRLGAAQPLRRAAMTAKPWSLNRQSASAKPASRSQASWCSTDDQRSSCMRSTDAAHSSGLQPARGRLAGVPARVGVLEEAARRGDLLCVDEHRRPR